MAAGLRCWGRFREVAARPHFSPSEEAASARLAFFPAGRTSQRFLPHLGEACIRSGRSLSRKTEVVAQAVEGSARAGGRIRAPKSAVSRALFAKMVSGNRLPDGVTRAVKVSWAFLLRGQLDCLPPSGQLPRGIWEGIQVSIPRLRLECGRGRTQYRYTAGNTWRAAQGCSRKCICEKYLAGSSEIRPPAAVSPNIIFMGARL